VYSRRSGRFINVLFLRKPSLAQEIGDAIRRISRVQKPSANSVSFCISPIAICAKLLESRSRQAHRGIISKGATRVSPPGVVTADDQGNEGARDESGYSCLKPAAVSIRNFGLGKFPINPRLANEAIHPRFPNDESASWNSSTRMPRV
jgi:hypothetical protein